MNRIVAYACLVLALAFAGFCHFWGLDWGAPSARRTLNVFGSRQEADKWVPEMIRQRNEYYAVLAKMLDKNQSFEENYKKQFTRWDTQPWQPIPQNILLDRMRNYIIGMNVSDEQITMSAISAVNPKKLNFAPGSLGYYGGYYYYTAGAFLVAGKLLGRVSLNTDVEYYFSHPEEIRRMYELVRAVSGVAILATIAFLFFIGIRLYNPAVGAGAALMFAVMPLMVPFSHLAKAHFLAAFWITAGLYFCALYLRAEDDRKALRHAIVAGLFLGLSAGAIITNLTAVLILLVMVWMRTDYNLKWTLKSREFWLPAVLFALVYAITNFYIFLRLPEYLRLIRGMVTFFTPYVEVQWKTWIPYLRQFWTEYIHWSVLPLLFLGIWYGFKLKAKFILLCVFTFALFFLHNLFLMRHAPVNARLLPVVALLAGWGAYQLAHHWRRGGKAAAYVYVFLSLGISAIQSDYYRRWHRDPSNLDLAGEWINANVPKGASIGAWGGGVSPQDFPAMKFMNYRMIHLPHADQLNERLTPKKLPDYVIVNGTYEARYPQVPRLTTYYQEVAAWEPPRALFGLSFPASWVNTGNWKVRVFKKTA